MNQIKLREVSMADLNRCYEIETRSYRGEEAASREKIRKRIVVYPQGFVVLEHDGLVVGFINAGATHSVELCNDQLKELVGHDPEGRHIVIMSVAVHPDHQRKGYANRLLTFFIEKMRRYGKSDIYLICQQHLIKMYANHGFRYLSISGSNHGGLNWHEMYLPLDHQTNSKGPNNSANE